MLLLLLLLLVVKWLSENIMQAIHFNKYILWPKGFIYVNRCMLYVMYVWCVVCITFDRRTTTFLSIIFSVSFFIVFHLFFFRGKINIIFIELNECAVNLIENKNVIAHQKNIEEIFKDDRTIRQVSGYRYDNKLF